MKKYKIIKEEHQWTSDIKLKFMGYGEWVEEVDNLEFEYKDYLCRVFRIFAKEPFTKEEAYFGGHLCGYIKIPNNHPFFKDNEKMYDLKCHGAITYNKNNDEEHWIGFDCAHLDDYVPTMEHMRKTIPELRKLHEIFPLPKGYESFALFNPSYKNISYVISECIDIVEQLIKVPKVLTND